MSGIPRTPAMEEGETPVFFHDTERTKMTNLRGSVHDEEVDYQPCRDPNKKEPSAADKAHLLRVQRLARDLRELSLPTRSCGSDSVSLETEGTGISTLTGSSGGDRRHNRTTRDSTMLSAPYTIFEDEHATQASYISRPIDVDSMQEYDEDEAIGSRANLSKVFQDDNATQSSYISRPIDVDSMQEYDEEEELKPKRLQLDDSPSRTTASSHSSSGPIDVDSSLEHDPEEHPESRLADEHFERIMNFEKAYYEGESLLEYSSDEDGSIDFEQGLSVRPSATVKEVHQHLPESPPKIVTPVNQTLATDPSKECASVTVIGPICLDTSFLLQGDGDNGDAASAAEESYSFRFRDFPILDELEMDRGLVGYIEGFEPIMEELPPRPRLRRKPSDSASTRSASSRVTFEI